MYQPLQKMHFILPPVYRAEPWPPHCEMLQKGWVSLGKKICFAKNCSIFFYSRKIQSSWSRRQRSLCTLTLLLRSSLGLDFGYLGGRTWSWMEHPCPPLSIALLFTSCEPATTLCYSDPGEIGQGSECMGVHRAWERWETPIRGGKR